MPAASSHGPTLLKGDRRRFKDAYGPRGSRGFNHLSPPSRRACFADQEDVEHNQQVIDLELQVRDARAEAQQLRSALRVSSNALAHAAALLPPEYSKDVQAHENLHSDLVSEIANKDKELLRLKRVEFDHHNVGARYRRCIYRAVQNWAPNGNVVLLKTVMDSWSRLQQYANMVKEMRRMVERLKPGICNTIRRWSDDSVRNLGKAVLVEWAACCRKLKALKFEETKRKEIIHISLASLGQKNNWATKSVCWVAWRGMHAERQQSKRYSNQRLEMKQAAKQLRVETIARAVLGMDRGRSDDNLTLQVGISFRSWRDAAAETKRKEKLEMDLAKAETNRKKELERAELDRKEMKEQVKRFALVQLCSDSHNVMRATFDSWSERHLMKKRRREYQAKMRDRDEKAFLLSFFWAWHALVSASKPERELKRELEDLKELVKEKEEKRLLEENARFLALQLVGKRSTDPKMLLQYAFQIWFDVLKDAKAEAEKEKWKSEWEQQQKNVEKQRSERDKILLFAGDFGGDPVLLQICWLCWIGEVEVKKSQHSLSAERRIFEAEMQETKTLAEEKARKMQEETARLLEEAERLKLQAEMSFERHRKEQLQRELGLTMALSMKFERGVIRSVWDAWREAWLDAQANDTSIVKRFSEFNQEHAAHLINKQVTQEASPNNSDSDATQTPMNDSSKVSLNRSGAVDDFGKNVENVSNKPGPPRRGVAHEDLENAAKVENVSNKPGPPRRGVAHEDLENAAKGIDGDGKPKYCWFVRCLQWCSKACEEFCEAEEMGGPKPGASSKVQPEELVSQASDASKTDKADPSPGSQAGQNVEQNVPEASPMEVVETVQTIHPDKPKSIEASDASKTDKADPSPGSQAGQNVEQNVPEASPMEVVETVQTIHPDKPKSIEDTVDKPEPPESPEPHLAPPE